MKNFTIFGLIIILLLVLSITNKHTPKKTDYTIDLKSDGKVIITDKLGETNVINIEELEEFIETDNI